MAEGELILAAGALLAAGLVASLLAGRVRVPGLVLFLGIGMLVGTDGLGLFSFTDYALARDIGIVALALILFEGGLTSGLVEIRPVLAPATGLAIVGTLVTAVIGGLVASAIFDLTTLEGLLLGSIVASTDGAAIFGLLRGSALRRRLARTLEGEAGLNDPVAVLLVLGFIDAIQKPGYGAGDMALLFVRQLGIGGGIGALVGVVAVFAFRRLRLATPGLYPVGSIAVAGIAYGAADTLGGSGFLAVYLAGLALGTGRIPARVTITAFHQGFAWVGQLVMFFVLGLLVFPSRLDGVALQGTALALVVAFVARPVATWAGTAFSRFSIAERVVLGWAGLRGAVPVVLATFPVLAHVPHSVEFFDIVFFSVLVSTVLQGATFELLAQKLGMTTSEPALPRPLAETGTIRRLGAEIVEYPIAPDDAIAGARVRDLMLPREALVNVIVRGGEAIPPRGSTPLEAGDRLYVLVRGEAARELERLLDRWHHGPIGPPPRVRLPPAARPPVFSVRRWSARDGDPATVERIGGRLVVDRVRTRRDATGALLALEDGSYAVAGPLLAIGGRDLLGQWARRRAHDADDPSERAWWEEVLGALAV